MRSSSTLINRTQAMMVLKRAWEAVESNPKDRITDRRYSSLIKFLVSSKTKAYRYAILTQVLAKATDSHINCLSLQAKAKTEGHFDARSFARYVVYRFEMDNWDGALGASEDPYVGKPLRHDEVSLEYLSEIKDKEGWRKLYEILKEVQKRNSPELTHLVLEQILVEVNALVNLYKREEVVTEEGKSRNLNAISQLIQTYLSEKSGGRRTQVIVYAVVRKLSYKYNIFKAVYSKKVNVADMQARSFADIECFSKDGKLSLAIAVTDMLTEGKLVDEISKSKARHVENLLVMANAIDISSIDAVIERYSKGVNISVAKTMEVIPALLLLMGQSEWNTLMNEVTKILKEYYYNEDRERWIDLLKSLKSSNVT